MRFFIHFFMLLVFSLTSQNLGAKVKEEQIEKGLGQQTTVVLETTDGRIDILLWPDVAPKACENFEKLVEKGYYNGVIFHRVIKSFMIQTGDPTGTGRGGESIWGKPFEDEVLPDVTFDRPGLVGMANAGPSTNGSQFFITTVATPWLNMKHTIFGKVVRGMKTVGKIENRPTDANGRPFKEHKIIKAYVTKHYVKN